MATCTKQDLITALTPLLSGVQADLTARLNLLGSQNETIKNIETELLVATKALAFGSRLVTDVTARGLEARSNPERAIRTIAAEIIEEAPGIDAQTEAYLSAQLELLPGEALGDAMRYGLRALPFVPASVLGERARGRIALATALVTQMFAGGQGITSAYLSALINSARSQNNALLDRLGTLSNHLLLIEATLFVLFEDLAEEDVISNLPQAIRNLTESRRLMDRVGAQLSQGERGFFNDALFERGVTLASRARNDLLPQSGRETIRTLSGKTLRPIDIANDIAQIRTTLSEMPQLMGKIEQDLAITDKMTVNIINFRDNWSAGVAASSKEQESLEQYQQAVGDLVREMEAAQGDPVTAVSKQAVWSVAIAGILGRLTTTFSDDFRRALRGESALIAYEARFARVRSALLDAHIIDFGPVKDALNVVIRTAPGIFFASTVDNAQATQAKVVRSKIHEARRYIHTITQTLHTYNTALSGMPESSHPLVNTVFDALSAYKFGGWESLLRMGDLASLGNFEESTITSAGLALSCLNEVLPLATPRQAVNIQGMITYAEAQKLQGETVINAEEKIAEARENVTAKELSTAEQVREYYEQLQDALNEDQEGIGNLRSVSQS